MSEPNLFKYATSELSQDAFICWLLEWAKEANKTKDPALHAVARNMIRAMFEKAGKKDLAPLVYDSVDIYKQYKDIDVLVLINNEYALIIEDKTRTSDHSGQLERYLAEISEHGVIKDNLSRKFEFDKIIPIYFKTYDQSDYQEVMAKGYFPFVREDILNVLRDRKMECSGNSIFSDFLWYLEDIETGVMSYRSKALVNWKGAPWIGFFKVLDNQLEGKRSWQYVNNSSGGFWGYNWAWKQVSKNPECHLFLQLEEHKLCYKMMVEDKESQGHLLREWFELISCAGNGYAVKAGRHRSGTWMTIASYGEDGKPADYRISKADGTIDVAATVKRLKEAEVILDRAIAERGMQQ